MKAWRIGRKSASKTFSLWPAASASASVGPDRRQRRQREHRGRAPGSGRPRAALGPNSESASARPSAMATGVRFHLLVTSPMAYTPSARGVQPRIHRHRAGRIERDAQRFQAQPGGVGAAAGGVEHEGVFAHALVGSDQQPLAAGALHFARRQRRGAARCPRPAAPRRRACAGLRRSRAAAAARGRTGSPPRPAAPACWRIPAR